MEGNKLKEALRKRERFLVLAELTGGPGYSYAPIEKFLARAKEQAGHDIPREFTFAGITLPQNPGGVANIEPGDVIAKIESSDLLNGLGVIPHISCKDANTDAIFSSLIGYRERGIQTVLALTGDKPVSAKGVFELDSVSLLAMIASMNREAWLKAKPGQWDQVRTFLAGAAVSPFKYTEPSQMQQYYKMEKKISVGADFLITQVGWDWKKSLEMFRYMADNGLEIPVVGNVYLLSTMTPAPRLMHDGKLPGCYVSGSFYEKVRSEKLDAHIARAAQQIAMYKAIGATGVDLGGVPNYDIFVQILQQAAQIGDHWEQFKDNLYFPPPQNAFYLYDDQGTRRSLDRPKKKFRQRWFNFMHRSILDPDYRGFRLFRGIMHMTGAEKGRGFAYRSFNMMEKAFKYTAFECQECGDCYLPENFGYCTMGGCEKGLANAPCGDSTVDGKCGNNLDTVCRGEQIYLAAAAELNGRDRLRTTINKPRNPALSHSSSILNYLFGKDHTMKNALISIGESIHASIPKTGKVMQELVALGPGAYDKESGPLNYIKALIIDQAQEGADYIAINVDAFGESDPQLAKDLMVQYVKLVRRWGQGVPACMDSSDNKVLKAGLKEWYSTGANVKLPLINSIKVYTADEMMPLKKECPFAFIGLLMTEEKATGPGGSHSVDELYELAIQLFDKAVKQHSFKPQEIFFDSTVFPLAIDMPMEPGVPGYTYRAFETIKKIKSDSKMKGVHCSLGISNCCRDLPARRIGICRAYVAKAMEYGLDAGIVNVNHHYGQKEVDSRLYDMIDAFARMDGSAEATNRAMMLMGQFCAENRK
ncbi:MAG: methylenetetrahydrofolate reductase C-terminal domain-containing protein [Sedimentisphaerales bacterium]|nr:methylenetetrahydrofolate reductase C-terminal domain-containing protein [Sedimentisphaerales bacterium]